MTVGERELSLPRSFLNKVRDILPVNNATLKAVSSMLNCVVSGRLVKSVNAIS